MKTIYDFYSSDKPNANTAGGKALKLMELFDKIMPVPAGIVLTTDFFTPWIDILKESDSWHKLSTDNSETLVDAANQLQTICSMLEYSKEQRRQFDESFLNFQQKSTCTLFAVRSSSPEEDMDSVRSSTSFAYERKPSAPQHRSFYFQSS